MKLGTLAREGGVGCSETLSRDFRGKNALRKILGPKGHLDWLIIDLNVAKIITVSDNKCTKNQCEWKYTYTAMLMLRVKQVTYETQV